MKTKQPQKRKRPLTDAYLNNLPLWKLLSIAMTDLRKQERAKNSVVDMDWYYETNGECSVCLAGAVLRWSRCVTARQWRDMWVKWPFAINDLRRGRVTGAAELLDRKIRMYARFDREISDYHDNRDSFWRDITQLRDDLKKAGF